MKSTKISIIMLSMMASLALAAPRPEASDLSPAESVHYAYDRHYGYGHHHLPYDHYGHGYAHKYGYHHNGHHHAHGYEHGYDHVHHHVPAPYAGYVPVYGVNGVHDHAHGYAYGHDLIGPFDHHTGPFGPFGFYANFYHD